MKVLLLQGYGITVDAGSGQILQIKVGEDTLPLRGSFWKIETGDRAFVTIWDMTSFTYTLTEEKLTLFWNKDTLTVKVQMFVQDALLKMDITVASQTLGLNRILFPVYEGIEKISGNDDYLTLPYQNGFLIKNPVDSLLKTDGEFPFWMGRGGHKYENEYPAQYSYQFFSY